MSLEGSAWRILGCSLADGNLLKGGGSEVYVMEAGVKRHITSPSALADCG